MSLVAMLKTLSADWLFPPRCLTCEASVSRYGTLCGACWTKVDFIAEPFCDACGAPQEYALSSSALCETCTRRRFPFSRGRAVMHYNDFSRQLLFSLKYQDETRLAPVFGQWMAMAGREMLQSVDVIVPVPLHYRRFLKRRYNQAALLAQALARHTSTPYIPDALVRTRATTPQAGLSRRERLRNVTGAFAPHPRHALMLQGKSVLLIDDVLTTGASLSACTRALLKAGCLSVQVLTLARR